MPAIVETSRQRAALAALLQRHDRDRFLLAQFVPAARRDAVQAIYAFNYEIARIREVVREPMLGQIRLQWWREGIDAAFSRMPVRRHEVLTPLAAAIRDFGLSQDHFSRLIDAREHDLAPEPPATMSALESYAEESAAPLQLLVLEALDASRPEANRAAREAAISYALAGLLRATPFLARARRCILPQAAIAAVDFDVELLFAGKPPPGVAQIARSVADRAAHHLAAARSLRGQVPPIALPALLPAVLAAADLARLEQVDYDLFSPDLRRPDLWRGWRLTVAALRRRY